MAEHSLEEIANLQVSPEETREILRRLSAQEFGGEDVVTVGDISEVAHATPILVARILAEVRTVRVEELFESRLTDYDERLNLQADDEIKYPTILSQIVSVR